MGGGILRGEQYQKGYADAEGDYKEKMKEEGFVEQYAEGYKDGFRDGYLAAMKSLEEAMTKKAEEQGVEPIPWFRWWPW